MAKTNRDANDLKEWGQLGDSIAANASDPSRRRPATGPDAGAAET